MSPRLVGGTSFLLVVSKVMKNSFAAPIRMRLDHMSALLSLLDFLPGICYNIVVV